ncbi:GvpL/GvpF family gas vesicle protein [Streptomyces sp. PmtA]|uniref:GvpL/GvpF family gas vesicle protein n=1 Tax=Streptomyces sp. PmtA TaxID=3074275 RepID=UPI003036B799
MTRISWARDRAEAFRDEVSRAADDLDGVRVELTGPWAPYSFATPPDTAGAAEPPRAEDPAAAAGLAGPAAGSGTRAAAAHPDTSAGTERGTEP